ncbi:hypothetical protein GCM10010885_09850 [Alicyclobacillus cellulosilyticus]|uniref:HD-GYP domain-containing protein n=1 Tax=Alicyclobacillus cellulosilyticus TaxID=1003997 RepID=A0A917NIB1_9BACL|nr:HD domain-containing phosphohydrolase [Alicyclobacillus cellulosilyticus]GGJ02599.1 hypothetical protein GCM10010885_09850 [Alicyclobacillus cellulosilyticus]
MLPDVQLDAAKKLRRKGLYLAALCTLQAVPHAHHPEIRGETHNELGLVHYHLGQYREAAAHFEQAAAYANDTDAWVLYHIRRALAYRGLSDDDACYRILNQMRPFGGQVAAKTRGLLFANLAMIQGMYGLYEEAIASIEKSFAAFREASIHTYDVLLWNNLGVAHLERGDLQRAEQALLQALDLSQHGDLSVLAELGRLYFLRWQLSESLAYTERALRMVWSSVIRYEKEEIARLCRLLAHITMHLGHDALARRLNEKAQLLFGQLGQWRQWEDIAAELLRWPRHARTRERAAETQSGFVTNTIPNFLRCLDAFHAQELLHPKVSQWLDLRAHYAALLALELGLGERMRDHLVLASRLADYGLTALEPVTAANTPWSPAVFANYAQHPSLSARMAQALDMPREVVQAIADHHERWDGTGFPCGKSGATIHPLARILAVVDTYCTSFVFDHQPHDRILKSMVHESGQSLDPQVVQAFVAMHHTA